MRSPDQSVAAGPTTVVAIALLGDSQTIVCAAETRDKQKQGLVLREILLPNRGQRQQDLATPPMLLGYARVSKAAAQDTAAQVRALEAAGCTLGTVEKRRVRRGKPGRVRRQAIKAGTRVAAGTPVGITVAKRRKR